MFSTLLALLTLPLLAASGAPAKAGVLCVGPGCGGALQAEVESQLASVPTVEVVPGPTIAATVKDAPVQGAAAMDAAAQATELLARAEAEYFDADLVAAEKTLAQVNELQTRGAEAVTDRPRYFLLRSAVKVKKGDVAAAESLLASALQLDPDLTNDRFPPSMNEPLERARRALPARLLFRLSVVPPIAQVHVDGRPANGVLAVTPGKHQVVARAPGHRTILRTIMVDKQTRPVRIALPVALPTAFESAAGAWVFGGAIAQPPSGIGDLASRAGLERVVVIATRPLPGGGHEARAAVYAAAFATAKASAAPVPLNAEGDAPSLTTWIAESVRSATAPVPVAVKPPKKPRPAGATRPLTKRPAFWGGIGAVALAVIAGGAVAASSAPKDKTVTDDGRTTLHVTF